MKQLRIGVLGFGTVGAGVVENLLNNGDLIAARTGMMPMLAKVADLDITSDRGIQVPEGILTTDVNEVINAEDVDIIVELIGGTTFARELVVAALKKGKSVVTANKALLAEHGEELYKLADENGADIYFEAAVGGGIPVIKSLKEGLVSNHIGYMMGILNGTCNYILTRMENEEQSFDILLPDAQAAGYAEAEPSLDVDGFDTAHKTVILSSLAYGHYFTMEDVNVKGIRDIKVDDIKIAGDLDYRIKLLSIIKRDGDKVSLSVEPTLIPKSALLGSVNDVFNAVWINGDTVDNVMLYGRGAGRAATASAVVADIADCMLNIGNECRKRIPGCAAFNEQLTATAGSEITSGFYLRVETEGTGKDLVENLVANTDLEYTRALNVPEEFAVFTIDQATRAQAEALVKEISGLAEVTGEPVLLRLEELS